MTEDNAPPYDLSTRDGLIAHLDALAAQEWPDVRDVEGGYCLDCSRRMSPFGRGWACSCGRSIDAKGKAGWATLN
jgi:hypothetical protein